MPWVPSSQLNATNPGYHLAALLTAVTAIALLLSLGAIVSTASAEETSIDDEHALLERTYPNDIRLAQALSSDLPSNEPATPEQTLQAAQTALDHRHGALLEADPQDPRSSLLSTQSTNLELANELNNLQTSSASNAQQSLNVARLGVDHRETIAGQTRITASLEPLIGDQHAKLDTTEALLDLLEEDHDSDLAEAVGLAKLASHHQAQSLDLAWEDPLLPGHQAPSDAIHELLDRHDLTLTAEDEQAIAGLDELPQPLRGALTELLDAFLALEEATDQAYADTNQTRAEQWADANLQRDLGAFGQTSQGFTEDVETITQALAAGETTAFETEAAFEQMQSDLTSDLPDEEAGQALEDAGIDLAPVFPARNALLDATIAFQDAWQATSANAVDPVSLTLPPAVSIDLPGEDSTYDEDVALQIDVAGNDTYRNNAGGSNLENGACTLKNVTAAALVDLDGDDDYVGPRGCGAAGGGYLGTGFLLDAAGEDRYSPEGGWAPIREGQIATRLRELPDEDAASQADEDRFVVGFHEDPKLAPGDSYEDAEVITVQPTLAAITVDASDAVGFVANASEDPDVRYMEADGIVEAAGEFTPNDPLFDEQYALDQIQAPSAWDTTRGGTAKEICVVDTGVDFEHPDLNGTRWKGGVSTQMASDGPRDDNGHGTHVTGIAAATIDNGEGVAGVGNVGFLAAKGLSSIGFGFDSEIANAITWCADEGADVISMSLGKDSSSSIISDALEYAWDEGALLVAAAGNDGCYGCVQFPASHEDVIAVPCTDANRSRCDFSNYGPQTEIAAPGNDVLSTLPDCDGGARLCDESGYGNLSGTSMSTPYVSGAATLVWNEVPELTNAQMRQLLRDTAVDHVLGEDFDEAGCRPEIGYGVLDVDGLLQAALDGKRPQLQAKVPCTLFPGSWGTNGGGAVAGTGLLVDAGDDDVFLGEDFGTNGGGYMNGLGLLVSLAGNDTYQAGNDGTNGGGSTGTGSLLTGAGHDTYRGGILGTNGGGSWARLAADQASSAKDGLQHGSGFVFDASGKDTYQAVAGGANGGGYWVSTGFLFDGAGHDTYEAQRISINGGGEIAGVGTLVDATGDDRYASTSLHSRGANGGGYRAGAGILVDGTGSNAFEAGWSGSNGGTYVGSSFLYAGGIGDDTFKGCGRGTMGGGFAAAGFLFNAGGDNTYTDFPECGLLRWTEEAASNGGGYSIGAGFLMDVEGNDHYEGPEATNGGTDLWGVAMLLDGAGDDVYTGEIKGVNGGAWGLGLAFLVDAGFGDDTFLAEGWGANGGAGGVLGGIDLPMTTHGFLANQGGEDTYGDDVIPITESSATTSNGGHLDLLEPQMASHGAPSSFVVGFEEVPSDLQAGDRLAGGHVDRILPELNAVVVSTTSPLTFQANASELPAVSYVQEDETVEWTKATGNDPWRSWQIGLENTRLPEAWDTTFGDPGISLCIVDTGLYEDHEDIGNVLAGADLLQETEDATDGHGHGTYVAGVAAALSGNGAGITGASEAGLLVAKITNDDGLGTFSSAAEGIRWCADEGADVINLSIGGDHHPLMEQAVSYAWEEGALLVGSGGNSGGSVDYPAAYPEVLAVGCTDVNDDRCSFSPMGRELDVMAPGIDILGTVPPCDGQQTLCFFSGYSYATGTSASTAFVSGIAALVASVNPDISNCELKQLLRETAHGTEQEGHSPRFGYGIADAKAAMDRVQAGQLPTECPERGPLMDLGANGGGFNHGRGFLYEATGDDTYTAGGNGANGAGVDLGVGFLWDGAGGDTYQDDDEGTGVDRTVVPKGAGVQTDGPANPLPILNPRLVEGYRTLESAFAKAAPGDTILIREGVHPMPSAVLEENEEGQALDGLVLCPTTRPLDPSRIQHPLSNVSGPVEEPLACDGTADTVLEAAGQPTLLTVRAADVTVQNLTIRGTHTLVSVEDTRNASLADNRLEYVGQAPGVVLESTEGVQFHDNGVRADLSEGSAPALTSMDSRATVIEDNHLVASTSGPDSVGLRLAGAMSPRVAANTITGFASGVHLADSQQAHILENTLGPAAHAGALAMGLHLENGGAHELQANEIHDAQTGVRIDGTSNVHLEGLHASGVETGIHLAASTTQPEDVHLADNQLALTSTPLMLSQTTQDLVLDAPCNDWGAYHASLIEQRIQDRGTNNEITYEPWIGPTPELTTDCLITPQASFSFDPTQPTRLDDVAFTDESQQGDAPIVAWDWAFGDGETSSNENPTHTYDTLGAHEVRLTIEDAYGMTSTTTRTVTVANLAPTIEPIPSHLEANHTDTLSFSVTASDEDDDPDELSLIAEGDPLDGGAEWTDHGDGTATFTWQPDATDAGDHAIDISAEDPHGDTDKASITLTIVDNAPQIPAVANQATRLEHEVSFPVSATDPNGDPVHLEMLSGPEAASFEVQDQDTPAPEGTLSWTPTNEADVGANDIVFQASSHGLSSTQAVRVDVGPANTPPQLALTHEDGLTKSLDVLAGSTLELTVEVNDPDGPQVPTLTAEAPETWDDELTVTGEEETNLTAVYEAQVPNEQLAPVTLTFSADDGLNATQASLAVNVQHPPSLETLDPRIDTIEAPGAPVIAEESFHLRAQGQDIDGAIENLTFLVDGEQHPAQASGEEGIWIAAEAMTASQGTLAYEIHVEDDDGLTQTRKAQLTVVENPGPVATFPVDPIRVAGGLQTIELDASDSHHPLNRGISLSWELPAVGLGQTQGATAQWVPPSVGAYEATLTAVDALGASDEATLTILVEDDIALEASLLDEGSVDKRPQVAGLVHDEAGQAVSHARVWMNVTHVPTGERVTSVQRSTNEDGLLVERIPWDTSDPRMGMGATGANLPGEHVLEIQAMRDSDVAFTPDILVDGLTLTYTVE